MLEKMTWHIYTEYEFFRYFGSFLSMLIICHSHFGQLVGRQAPDEIFHFGIFGPPKYLNKSNVIPCIEFYPFIDNLKDLLKFERRLSAMVLNQAYGVDTFFVLRYNMQEQIQVVNFICQQSLHHFYISDLIKISSL